MSRSYLFLIAAAVSLFSVNAHAYDVTYTFTGLGLNGSTAAGTFTVDSAMTVPGYVGDSTIFTNFSLTITNIPQGPGSMTLGLERSGGSYESATNYFVDNSGTILIAPGGDFYPGGPGPGAQRVYQLTVENPGPGANSDPLIGDLFYSSPSGVAQVDRITWSPAIAAVPESSTWWVGVLGCVTIALTILKRKQSGRGSA